MDVARHEGNAARRGESDYDIFSTTIQPPYSLLKIRRVVQGFHINVFFGDYIEAAYPFMERDPAVNVGINPIVTFEKEKRRLNMKRNLV